MLDHTRRFCHAGGAVSVFMQRLAAPIIEEPRGDRLMMWKYCTQCQLITPIGNPLFLRVLRIRISFNVDPDTDPDPEFFVNSDPDPDPRF
jgi:hypothetical protein